MSIWGTCRIRLVHITNYHILKRVFAQINWYRYWKTDFVGSNYVVSAHFSWSTASDSIYVSGCGLSVGPRNSTPQVFILHRSKVLVLTSGGYDMRPQKGTGHVDISSPMEADFTLIANGSENLAYVLVNDKFVGKYKLDYSTLSNLGYVIFSGTSKDYGTRCEISNARVWKIKVERIYSNFTSADIITTT